MSGTGRKKLMKKLRIFIVDDHPIFRKGLIQLINEESDMEVCGEAEDVFSATHKVRQLKPDLVIADITLKDTSGLELIKFIQDNNLNIPSLVLSMHDEKVYAERALVTGARGYIMKQEMSGQVTSAIRQIISGKIYISESMNDRLLSNFLAKGGEAGKKKNDDDPASMLTGRELEIFRLIGKGYTRKDIAESLNLNVNTIGTYRERIKEKMNISSSNELLSYAIKWVQKTEE